MSKDPIAEIEERLKYINLCKQNDSQNLGLPSWMEEYYVTVSNLLKLVKAYEAIADGNNGDQCDCLPRFEERKKNIFSPTARKK